jgi:hypothetical protein
MRLCERDRRTVWLRRRGIQADAYGEPVAVYGQAVPLRVTHQPAGGGTREQRFGRRAADRRLIFYDGPEAVLEEDGICLRAAPGQSPDYRAAAVDIWDSYQRIEIERID